MGLLPAPLPRAGRDRRLVREAAQLGPRDRALSRRRVRLEVVHEDGADHGGAGAPRGSACADSEQRRGIDADHPPPRHARLDAHPCARGRNAALARGPLRPRHGRLRGQRAARVRNCGGRCAGAVPLAGCPGGRQLRVHLHLARRLLPGLRGMPPAVDRGIAGRRGRAARRSRSAGAAAPQPADPGRARATHRRQAARCRPDRRRGEGRGGDRLGRARAARRRARCIRRPARRRRPSGVACLGAPGTRWCGRGERRHHRGGTGRPHRHGADRRAGAGDRHRPRQSSGRRYRIHAV